MLKKHAQFLLLSKLNYIPFDRIQMKNIALLIFTLFYAANVFAQTETTVAIDPSLTESPISVKTFSGSVSGSLVMPKNATGKIPVVLIVADAGPTNRDGNNFKAGITGNTYKLLANDLGKNGIATIRYDKRMVGESVSTTKESQLRG